MRNLNRFISQNFCDVNKPFKIFFCFSIYKIKANNNKTKFFYKFSDQNKNIKKNPYAPTQSKILRNHSRHLVIMINKQLILGFDCVRCILI